MPRPHKPKVCPFTVCVDTREQAPFAFTSIDPFDEIPTQYIALKSGDYSIKGYESRITVERKSIQDLYGSIGADRERFEREMVRLASFEYAAVVIEGDSLAIANYAETHLQMAGKTAEHTMLSWSIKYRVHFWPSVNKRHAELRTFHLLRHFWRHVTEAGKAAEALAEEAEKAADAALEAALFADPPM